MAFFGQKVSAFHKKSTHGTKLESVNSKDAQNGRKNRLRNFDNETF